MSREARVQLVRRFLREVVGGEHPDALDAVVAEGVVEHGPLGGYGTGRDGLLAAVATLRGAFPDGRSEERLLLVQGDTVAYRGEWVGTHQGAFLGHPASGRPVRIGEHRMLRVDGDRIVEQWHELDLDELLRQIGAEGAAR